MQEIPDETPNFRKFNLSALDYWGDECTMCPILTGSRNLDLAIGGGIDGGGSAGVPQQLVTELCGPPGSGKSQLCMQLCVNVQLPIDMGGKQCSAIHISSKTNGIVPKRLHDIAEAFVRRISTYRQLHPPTKHSDEDPTITTMSIMKNIKCVQVGGIAELLATLSEVNERLENGHGEMNRCALIVIDSLTDVLRTDSEPPLSSIEQVRLLAELMDLLDKIAVDQYCAIVLTNGLTTRISTGDGSGEVVPALGDTHAHRVAQVVQLEAATRSGGAYKVRKWSGDPRVFLAHVTKSLSGHQAAVEFMITGEGISDISSTVTRT